MIGEPFVGIDTITVGELKGTAKHLIEDPQARELYLGNDFKI